MPLFNLTKVRYIKDRQNCWRVIEDGNEIFKSEPNEKKDAVKNALALANKAYEIGFKEGAKKGSAQIRATVIEELTSIGYPNE